LKIAGWVLCLRWESVEHTFWNWVFGAGAQRVPGDRTFIDDGYLLQAEGQSMYYPQQAHWLCQIIKIQLKLMKFDIVK
jgi:hypothetical protein